MAAEPVVLSTAGPLPLDRSTAGLLALALGIALVHLVADEIPLDGPIHRHTLLSAAGGVSIAYVFIELFPTLHERAELLEKYVETLDGIDLVIESLLASHVYAVVFAGIIAFYGLERLAQASRSHDPAFVPKPIANDPVFWVHVGAFWWYNAFIGYVLVAGEPLGGPAPYAIAMALHLLGNDEALRNYHQESYHRYGRWALASAVVLGALAGLLVQLDPVTLTVVIGLLTGGILFNAIKDELPADRDNRFWAFAVGAGGYALLLIVIA